jgi:hypothetical protein
MGIGAKANTYEVWAVRGVSNGPAPVWKTGQSICYDNTGATIPCAGTGQDGEHQAGVTWPDPRFVDNGDGTITDNLTGLVWLETANCFGDRFWADALADAASLADGSCGLGDTSSAGAWRLPNAREIVSLVDHGRTGPALPDGHPFLDVPGSSETQTFWTSNSWQQFPSWGWMDTLADLGELAFSAKTTMYPSWPVRGEVLNPPFFADGFESGDTSAWSAPFPS